MASEKKRQSGGSETLQSQANPAENDQAADANDDEHSQMVPRQLYFNLPLPQDLLDEDGNPAQQFTRNKIRTAKYTPLSFVPKNLWFQFQNVANIFFLFLVIIVVSRSVATAPTYFTRSPADSPLPSSFPYSAARIQALVQCL